MTFDFGKYASNGEYVKFEQVGDKIVGIVTDIREGRTFNGDPCPELILEDDDGAEHTVTAGQVLLRIALAEKVPEVGDKIRIVFSGVGEAQPGKAAPKEFTVDVKRNAQPVQAEQKSWGTPQESASF